MPRNAIPISDIDLSKCGPDSPLHALAKKRTRGPDRKDSEHLEQVKLFAWAKENETRHPLLFWLFAVPNWFGARTAKQGARAKAEGRKPGVVDVWFPVQRGRYVGLAIEMKAGTNTPTKEQKLWLQHLRKQGWLAEVCYSFEDARDLVLAYLSGKEPTPGATR